MCYRWLAVFLLTIIPLQLTWTAASAYCQHENGAASGHFGHHNHEHKAADGKDLTPDPTNTGWSDPDCTACHAECGFASTTTATLVSVFESDTLNAKYQFAFSPPPIKRIERPKWFGLA